MVSMSLNEEWISAGEKLLRHLDETHVKVDAALWFYFADRETWKLLLSLPTEIQHGPKAAYEKVQKALFALGKEVTISLSDISIARAGDPLLKLLRLGIKTRKGISRIRFSKNVINGQLIEDALIYRLPNGKR